MVVELFKHKQSASSGLAPSGLEVVWVERTSVLLFPFFGTDTSDDTCQRALEIGRLA